MFPKRSRVRTYSTFITYRVLEEIIGKTLNNNQKGTLKLELWKLTANRIALIY